MSAFELERIDIRMSTDWHSSAACRGRTRMFYGEDALSQALAVAVCRSCDVRPECLAAVAVEEWGTGPRFGVRGGLTAEQRAGMRPEPISATPVTTTVVEPRVVRLRRPFAAAL